MKASNVARLVRLDRARGKEKSDVINRANPIINFFDLLIKTIQYFKQGKILSINVNIIQYFQFASGRESP